MPIETAPLPQTNEEMAQQLADSYALMAHLKAGGTQEIREQLLQNVIQTGDTQQILDVFIPDTNHTREWLQKHNPHPLTKEQEDDLKKNLGPPIFG